MGEPHVVQRFYGEDDLRSVEADQLLSYEQALIVQNPREKVSSWHVIHHHVQILHVL